jgi:hypothetical protein
VAWGKHKATCLRFKKTRKSCQQYRKEIDLEVNWLRLYKKWNVDTLDRESYWYVVVVPSDENYKRIKRSIVHDEV